MELKLSINNSPAKIIATFNRTSMELKPRKSGLYCGRRVAFNRTSMELKLSQHLQLRVLPYAFNRTSMELKPFKQVNTRFIRSNF